MKLEALVLKNFRSYKDPIRVQIGDLTTIIGKNDAGKSTLLEALEIFFNNSLIKLEHDDACVDSEEKEITIGCVFSDFEEDIVIDSSASTKLQDEFLLNANGLLEIHKVFDCNGKTIGTSTYAVANFPSNTNIDDLLYLKNADLKKRLETLGINDADINKSSNVSIRQGIYKNTPNIELKETQIDLDKEDAKKIWTKLKENLPMFALFQSDRASKDDDAEIQDPMKLAIEEVVRELAPELEKIKKQVKEKATFVAEKTIEKLKEMDPALAQQLNPNFKVEPKWSSIFKLSLTDDRQVPINKRGSGVRRLILINFFRADAERRQKEKNAQGIIYAIEEPETSQHPDNQEMLIKALLELSQSGNAQVILTTHVPALAGFIPLSSVCYISKDDTGKNIVEFGSNDIKQNEHLYNKVSKSLGILPETKIKLLLCVEGPNDVSFFKHISKLMHATKPELIDLSATDKVAFLPVGGSTLKQWVEYKYLQGLNKQEAHIYDLDDSANPPYKATCDEINARADGSWATLTSKKTIENYIHKDAIQKVLGVNVTFGDNDNVVEIVSQAKWELDHSGKSWSTDLSKNGKKRYRSYIKEKMNDEVVSNMTQTMLDSSDVNKDIESWLKQISSRV